MKRRNFLSSAGVAAATAVVGTAAPFQAHAHAGTRGGGRLTENIAMPSRVLGIDVLYSVYLPPRYGSAARRYPITYMLHGGSNTNTAWARKENIKYILDTAIARQRIPPMVVVMPDARRDPTRPADQQQSTYNMNDADGSFRYADMFIDEFIPFIESQYRVVGTPGARGIGGLSMGGFGALSFAMLNPGTFAGAIGLSAAHRTDKQIVSLDMTGYNHRYGRGWGDDLVGEERLNDFYYHYNLLDIIRRTPANNLARTGYYLDVGAYDQFFEGNADLHVTLADKQVPHRFMAREGEHTWEYWQSGLPNALEFLGDIFEESAS